MKLKSPWFPYMAAAAAVVTAIASPAQAATLAPGSTLNVSQFNPGAGVNRSSTQLNFFGPGLGAGLSYGSAFGNGTSSSTSGAFTIGASTGSFASYTLGAGLIKDLTIPSPLATQSSNFLQFAATTITLTPVLSFPTWTGRFDLGTLTAVNATTYTFDGTFRINGFDNAPGIGQLTFQDLSNPTSYSLSVSVIPTPALLPGLVGLGLATWRKRKEQAA
jgi:hypothetical protein